MKNSFKIFVILILAALAISFIETRTISGKVSDDQGNPLAGVTVKVKGAPTGTITDLKGNYKVTAGQEDKIFIFSFAGYTTVEQKIGERSIINVTMKSEFAVVDDMVENAMVMEPRSKKDMYYSAAPVAAGASTKLPFPLPTLSSS